LDPFFFVKKMKTIRDLYWDWANELPYEDVEDPFSETAEWKGHMVMGFVKYIEKARRNQKRDR